MLKNTVIALLSLFLSIVFYKEKYLERILQRIHPSKPQQHDYLSNDQYTEQTDLQTIYNKKGRVVMLGNSLFYRVRWNELLQRDDIINRGVGSDITEGYLHRMQLVYNTGARVCFLEGGINDIVFRVPFDSSAQHVMSIVQGLRANGLTPVCCAVIPVAKHYYQYEKINAGVARYNAWLTEYCAREHIQMVNINAALAPSGVLLDEYARPDGIHLRSAAYIKWKTAIEAVLREMKI